MSDIERQLKELACRYGIQIVYAFGNISQEVERIWRGRKWRGFGGEGIEG